MANVPILKFMFRTDWKALSDALQSSPANEAHDFNSANELVSFFEGTSAGLIIASLSDKNDLIQIATLMKFLKRGDTEACTKIAVVNTSGDKQFEKAIAKLGILDILDPKLQMKSLRFKIDYMMKSVASQIKKKESATASQVKTLETKTAQEKKAISNQPVWTDPLNCHDDVWIIRSESDCKKVLSRWLVKLTGPSPYVAGWIETTTRGVWKFEFKVNAEVFMSGSGAWYFQGDQKPDYIWSENSWSFTGNAFELFYKSEKEQLSRMKLEGNQFAVARTSEAAKKKEKIIQESFDKNLVLKSSREENNEKNSFEKEENEFKNLEGKGKTEAIHHKALSGKSSTSHLNTDPLKMDLEEAYDDKSLDPHSLKTSTSKEASFWKGTNKYDKEEKKSKDLSTEIDEVSQGTQLALKASSEHKTHYKNHNEAEKFDAQDNPHSQKTSTSKGSSFWKGKNEYTEDETIGELSAPVLKHNEGSELSNQSKNTHEKFLRNHNEAEKFEAKEKNHSLTKEGVSENLKGRIGTDKNKEKETPELKGASSTEKMKGHISSPNVKDEPRIEAEKETGVAKNLSTVQSTQKSKPEAEAEKETPHGNGVQAEKEKVGKPSKDNLGGYLSSQNANREPSKDAVKMAERLAELKVKKEKIDKDNKSENTLKTEIELEKSKALSPAIPDQSSEGKILQFPENDINKSFENMSLGSKELDTATLNASITSILTQGQVKVSCHLDDQFEQTIIFVAPKNSLSIEKPVSLDLNFSYLNKKTNLKFTGKVTQIDLDEEGLSYITVEISKENAKAFNSFMQMYQIRQKNIDLFLKTVKGF